MHIYLINLKSQTTRLTHMRQQFDKCGLDFEVFEATIGKDLNRGQNPEAVSLSDGELGCFGKD